MNSKLKVLGILDKLKGMNKVPRLIILVLCLVYIFVPADLLPLNPIDDLIVAAPTVLTILSLIKDKKQTPQKAILSEPVRQAD